MRTDRLWTDRQIDKTKLIVAFRNFLHAPENGKGFQRVLLTRICVSRPVINKILYFLFGFWMDLSAILL